MNSLNALSPSRMRSRSTVTERLEQLLAELRAINAWDLAYLSRRTNDEIDRAARDARRIRLEEICEELGMLLICLEIPMKLSRN
jgi:hypothetical protein